MDKYLETLHTCKTLDERDVKVVYEKVHCANNLGQGNPNERNQCKGDPFASDGLRRYPWSIL
jgi:hypothetical protein